NMPSYGKFFNDLVTKKRKFEDGEKVVVYEAASAMQHDLPKKERDSGGFIIQIALGNGKVASGMVDLRAEINLMPFSIFQRLGLGDLRPTRMCLQLADRSIRYPKGVVEDVFVKVGKLIIPVDFIVLDVGDVHENGKDHTILLGRPFMATINTLIDVKNGTLNMTVLGESVSISVQWAMSSSSVNFIEECAFIDIADPFVDEMVFQEFEDVLLPAFEEEEEPIVELFEVGEGHTRAETTLELKELPKHFKYVFLDDAHQKPVIIFAELDSEEEEELIRMCIDYSRLNAVTKKDHFPLPFIDQILDRLSGHQFYCFLDGLSGYYQVAIAPEDQPKTTFT
ncbi:Unknown protein, partial [Striga hermonthica]